MLLIPNVFVVELIRRNPLSRTLALHHFQAQEGNSTYLLIMRRPEQIDEIPLEIVAKVVDKLLGVLADNLQVADVALTLHMALESVGIATLLLAGLAPPAQPLQPLGLHLVGDPFRASGFRFAHGVCRGMCVRAVDAATDVEMCGRGAVVVAGGARRCVVVRERDGFGVAKVVGLTD